MPALPCIAQRLAIWRLRGMLALFGAAAGPLVMAQVVLPGQPTPGLPRSAGAQSPTALEGSGAVPLQVPPSGIALPATDDDSGQRAALLQAAQAGDVRAQLTLGYGFFSPLGGGTPRYAEAFRWFSRAAGSGDPRALLALGHLHAEGRGTPRNIGLARDYLDRARAMGLHRANAILAELEQALPPGKRRHGVMELLREGAAAGDGPSGNALGAQFEVQGNVTQAEQAYRNAERAGSRSATLNLQRLAGLRERGDRTAVVRLMERARVGDADAAYELAVRYHRGEGVAVNYSEAIRYYQRAAAKGHVEARRMLTLVASRSSATGDINGPWLLELSAQVANDAGDAPRIAVTAAPVSESNLLIGLLAMPG